MVLLFVLEGSPTKQLLKLQEILPELHWDGGAFDCTCKQYPDLPPSTLGVRSPESVRAVVSGDVGEHRARAVSTDAFVAERAGAQQRTRDRRETHRGFGNSRAALWGRPGSRPWRKQRHFSHMPWTRGDKKPMRWWLRVTGA